jgi:hypothetical protein
MIQYDRHFRCSVHDITFAMGAEPNEDHGAPRSLPDIPMPCPFCVSEQNRKLRAQVTDLRRQRDALAEAIDVKNLILVESLRAPVSSL